ncbi:MAG: prolyl oligopeptidase family serine peptidase [Solirubrobacteraceae bacterium]
MADSFPRQKARTRNFTLGAARDFQVAADGSRVVFLRSPAGDDPLTALWVYDVAEGEERLVADPRRLVAHASLAEHLSPDEQAQRERKRETAGGIVAYATDNDARLATFVFSGMLWVADLRTGASQTLGVPGPILDPRLDGSGGHVAFVHDGALYVASTGGGAVRRLVGEDDGTVTWGLAEFVAAEEMGRDRGYWWAPDGATLLVARVDEAPVRRWWIADGADPGLQPREVRYPAAGTANAAVSLHLVSVGDAPPVEVQWEQGAYPYLLAAHWDEHGPLIAVQTRDQRLVVVLAVDARSGATTPISEQHDETWVERVDGVPRRLSDGRLVTVANVGDSSSLAVAETAVTPRDIEVRGVLDVRGDCVLFSASTEPSEVHVWRWSATDGLSRLTTAPGVHTAAVGGDVCVVGSSGLGHDGVRWTTRNHLFGSRAETPVITPTVKLMTVGERRLRVGVVFPQDHEPGRALPVLMDPYGGPGHQRVVVSRQSWREAQWLADQGFAVIVADGRGTPGRGRTWSRAIHRDLAGPPLDDQIAGLTEVAAVHGDLDLTRVAIRGWSFGGYLAALAVLRRPDVFHAAIAGAPVTDWRLYDTHYSERYLGTDPEGADRAFYDGSSLLEDPRTLQRPLLLIHGLTDDNVVAAHTLLLSRRLLESGRPHTVLPLPGVTHMTPQAAVAENLLLLQVDFLHRTLSACR